MEGKKRTEKEGCGRGKGCTGEEEIRNTAAHILDYGINLRYRWRKFGDEKHVDTLHLFVGGNNSDIVAVFYDSAHGRSLVHTTMMQKWR